MKFLIIAPFWGSSRHVGVYRVERFIRWLAKRNIPIVLVKRGDIDHAETTRWGVMVSIRYPLKKAAAAKAPGPTRTAKHSMIVRFLRWLADRLLIPDSEVAWAWRAASHPLVMRNADGVTHVLSSSPPESPHVGAYRISRRLKARHVVDMRDGWLDEPLRPILQRSRFRQFLEGAQERRILKRADKIFVTSEVWKELLETRLPFAKGKTTVLTNAYPSDDTPTRATETDKFLAPLRRLTFLHSGRFTGSSLSRRPRHLLEPFLRGIPDEAGPGELLLLGDLSSDDTADISELAPLFKTKNWTIRIQERVSREECLRIIQSVDGLLLLSTSHAAIPSKLFEYIPSRKPVLALTPVQSAVWRIGEELPQIFLIDLSRRNEDSISTIAKFIEASKKSEYGDVPLEFSEEHLSRVFYRILLDE